MTGREWIDAFASALAMDPPDDDTVDSLLELAGVAAHSSERIAAPIACWLVGRAGLTASDARRVADGIGTDRS
ncbi:MAG: DUF6457 domain-containing protein [Acidimicrobiales bacterium]